MIPRILHFVWLSDGAPMPEGYKIFFDRAVALHPGWEVKLWGYSNIHEIGLTREDLCCTSRAGDANVVRLYALNKFGGVYLDLDIEVYKSFEPLLDCESFAARQADKWFCNAVMGAVPNSRWIEWQIRNWKQWSGWGAEFGPYLSTQADRSGFTEYPTEYFYPWRYESQPHEKVPHANSYCAHHWACSWGTKQ